MRADARASARCATCWVNGQAGRGRIGNAKSRLDPRAKGPPLFPSPPRPQVPLLVWRGGEGEVSLAPELSGENGRGTGRLVHAFGLQLQEVHRAIRELGYIPKECSATVRGVT